MKRIAIKLNPAFKRTQPLPVLSVDFQTRAGGRSRSIDLVAETSPTVAVRAVGAVVPAGFGVRLAGTMN